MRTELALLHLLSAQWPYEPSPSAPSLDEQEQHRKWWEHLGVVDALGIGGPIDDAASGAQLQGGVAFQPTDRDGSGGDVRRKVAFLFLLGQPLMQPDVWATYFQAADPERYSIYAHPGRELARSLGSNKTVAGLAGVKLIKRVPSEWCALFGAEVALLRAALEDRDAQQFVFVSDDAVPVVSFERAYADLMREPSTSSFCLAPDKQSSLSTECNFWKNWQADIPKHGQWLVVARRHAERIVKNARPALATYRNLTPPEAAYSYSRDACSDEVAPLAALLPAANGGDVMSALMASGIRQACHTFVHWEGCVPDELDVSSGRVHPGVITETTVWHPTSFFQVSWSYVHTLQHAGFLFARKFKNTTTGSLAGFVGGGGRDSSSTVDNKELDSTAAALLASSIAPLSRMLPELWASFDAASGH